LASRILSFRGGQLLPFPVLNVWQSEVVDVSGDLAELAAGNVRIWWAGNARRGETCEVTVDPESVLLAREPVHSSARNCLPGRITRLEGDEAARLTAAAARELQLAAGAPVYVVFKASAVHRVAEAIDTGPCSRDTRGNENGEDS
jgi:ABC-type molybdate transport system ATPase subunit